MMIGRYNNDLLYLCCLLNSLIGVTALSQHQPPQLSSPPINIFVSGRRDAIHQSILASLCIGTISSSWVSPQPAYAMYENGPTIQSAPIKIGSTGVTYQDLRIGNGDTVKEGNRVNIQWVLKRSNGYDIDSSSNNDGVPFIFVVGSTKDGNNRAIQGLDIGIRGMKVGGIRRIVIPPNMSYIEGVEDGKPGPMPKGFGPKQRIKRVMKLLKDVPGESFLLDVKTTLVK